MSRSRSLLSLIDLVDNAPPSLSDTPHPFYRLRFLPDPRTHGLIHPDTLAALRFPPCFAISPALQAVDLREPPPGVSPSAHATAALQAVVDAAIASPQFPAIAAHSEPFLIVGARHRVTVERFAASLFGIATRGAHLTAYVRHPPQPSCSAPEASARPVRAIWVARRSAHLHTHPGLWDSTVAGGVKAHDSPAQCVRAEALEEASLPPAARARITPAGALTLANINPRGLFHSEILYVYDLDLTATRSQGREREDEGPRGLQDEGAQGREDETARERDTIVPTPNDDEVERFVLMPCEEVTARMLRGEFKPNVCPVIIDFMLRHALITPENEPDYAEICARLHRRLPVPMRPDQ